MRYGIFSDIHGNIEAATTVIDALRAEGVDRLIFLGDIVGYGADPRACVNLMRETSALVAIAGNHDWAVAGKIHSAGFNVVGRRAIEWTKSVLNDQEKHYLGDLPLTFTDEHVHAVHGALVVPEHFGYLYERKDILQTMSVMERQICFVGHTHVPLFAQYDLGQYAQLPAEMPLTLTDTGIYVCNVGSVGQPRDGNSRAAYCIYDAKKKLVEMRRCAYNINDAQHKIRKAGLPDYLASRLSQGR